MVLKSSRSKSSVIHPPYCTSETMYCTVLQLIGVPTVTVVERYRSRKLSDASKSELLYSYGTHHPIGPNLRRSWTMECSNARTKQRIRHLSLSILSRTSCDTIVLYVRESPAFKPIGGSKVTLIAICSSPIGKRCVISQVIQRRKSSVISGVLPKISSWRSMKPIPKWQFWRMTQVPARNPFFIFSKATTSWPSPMETLSVGNFFFFLARSPIIEVGSDPAERR